MHDASNDFDPARGKDQTLIALLVCSCISGASAAIANTSLNHFANCNRSHTIQFDRALN
ncbi:hypothetical protein BRPE64_DCDS11560 (plasmid) [Caballeronia insecticola]|uniref:Uncharacterized protein n=1 Tax=Caballeronia insecticola TaxID=758793 RepID=R4X5C8_9BURK|nr:hypothetical protein BRPE64_DCDS11560 [Caballeronia insecticola]